MKRSTDRIITSHTGSLFRPLELQEFMRAKINGHSYDEAAYQQRLKEEVGNIVRQQVENGVDVPDDGEFSKPMFADYVADRISGFGGNNTTPGFVNQRTDPPPFPQYAAAYPPLGSAPGLRETRPLCIGPLAWKDRAYETDIRNLKAAISGLTVQDAFLPSPSPGIIAMRIPNTYYASEEEYVNAVAEVLREEYEAIAAAGLILQIDAPDAGFSWDRQQWRDFAEFRAALEMRIESLNHALRNVPEDQVRFHVCWGNGEAPHVGDVELKDIVDLILKVKAQTYSIEASNPRHAHEWVVWRDHKLPEGKILMPGVIDSVTNFVEHPELVAQRLIRFAELVGRENVIAGTDCGFGTGASPTPRVHPEIAMAKLKTMAEGARLASQMLWS